MGGKPGPDQNIAEEQRPVKANSSHPAPPPREGQAQIPYFTGVNLCPYMPEIGPSGKTPFSLPAARKVLAELRADGIRHVEQEWRFLATRVRGIFPGLLTY